MIAYAHHLVKYQCCGPLPVKHMSRSFSTHLSQVLFGASAAHRGPHALCHRTEGDIQTAG